MKQASLLPARDQVAEILRKSIFTGELERGQELTQEKVAEELGTSRMPVREAFQILEREGILTIQKRRAIVQGLTIDDIVDHLEIRAMLEGEAAARANLKGEKFEDIKLALANSERAALSMDVFSYVTANEALHRAIWAASGSSRLENFLNYLWTGVPPHLPALLPKQMDRSISEHQNIVKAICTGTSDEARDNMIYHIRRSIDDLIKHHKDIASDKTTS
ncbi:LysR family transcriptional regulator [Priestia megaterium]|uniref:GntR family transcriptional regulator n=1 Tax=Priestia megaterium TaxID=1404 RepID=UPI000BFC655A|nr:GntR family transcriptional regulator [Priestia megaterium]PGN53618.1 LysR family transcriptional regulator [Priestia megaterium]PGQ87659.1 LysR family transcriptional regulator [Priestia megaterium]